MKKNLNKNLNLKKLIIILKSLIPDISNLAAKTALTTVENRTPDINNLAPKTALTTVENKIPDIGNLVKKTDYNTKITDIENKLNNHDHDKYINTSEFNKLAADVSNTRIAKSNLTTKTDFDAILSSLNRKITKNKTKRLLVENELNQLKISDSSYFRGKNYFDEDDTQNYYIFQPLSKYWKVAYVNDINYILSWKSKGLNDIKIESIKTNNYLLNPRMDDYDMNKIRIIFFLLKNG